MIGNIYESYKPLMEDWKENIQVVKEHIENFSDIEATQLAILLENTQSELQIAKGRMQNGMLNEATEVSMINTMQSNVFDIITAVMPNLIANDIVSVQPLDRRTGQVFFLKFKYGEKKGEIPQRSDMLTSTSGFAGYDYSGEKISGEIIGAVNASPQTISYTLNYTPIKPGTVVITNGTASATDTDNGDGTGTLAGTLVAGGATHKTVNYTTGAISLDIIATAADVTADWEYDLNSASATVNSVEVTVDSVPVIARPRKLNSVYMFDTAYDLKMSFGLDMDTVIMKATSGEIGYEIDNEILTDLLNAAATTSTWNLNPTYKGMDIKEHNLTIVDAINNASNTILGATKRYEATFVVVGKTGANVIEGLGKDHYIRVATGGVVGGPHLCGVLEDKYKVYKNPNFADAVVLVGAKGEMFIEAGYIYAPYLPIFASQLLVDENLKGKRGFCTVYGKKTVNANMYHKITIANNTQVTDNA